MTTTGEIPLASPARPARSSSALVSPRLRNGERGDERIRLRVGSRSASKFDIETGCIAARSLPAGIRPILLFSPPERGDRRAKESARPSDFDADGPQKGARAPRGGCLRRRTTKRTAVSSTRPVPFGFEANFSSSLVRGMVSGSGQAIAFDVSPCEGSTRGTRAALRREESVSRGIQGTHQHSILGA